MAVFKTQHGAITVKTWGYQLQGRNGQPLDADVLANKPHDLIVMDFSSSGLDRDRFSAAEIDRIQDGPGGKSVVAAYMSIGEASDFRSHWRDNWTKVPSNWTEDDGPKASFPLTNKAPDWLGPSNPDWPESRKVRYWDKDWQDVIFNDGGTGWLDKIVKSGFDAAYLDIVDAYYYWGVEVLEDNSVPNSQHHAGDPANVEEAAVRMMRFIVRLTEHARETNPDFFVILQNGAFIMADAGDGHGALKARFLNAVGAIGVEDTYYRGNKDENNAFRPDNETIQILKEDFLGNGKPVFAVDYVNQADKVENFQAEATGDGFISYAAPTRELDRMGPQVDYSTSPSNGFDVLNGTGSGDALNGLGGDDLIIGKAGNDRLVGGTGEDSLRGGDGADTLKGGGGGDEASGGRGNDRIFGEDGRDLLNGDGGNDLLRGGARNDTLSGGAGHDTLTGDGGNDRLFGFAGNDLLRGGTGADTLKGGAGRDTLVGGGGADSLEGGTGGDTFVFVRNGGRDRITDFQDGIDVIDLTAFGYGSIAAVKADAFMKDGDAYLVLRSGATVIVEDTKLADLTAADFLI
ncbi:MAG: hypothetical protein C0606_11755 [Hyphomicrobiales bacterium]|nr:MAG: hypothetical protein C0606_11755 [Hyphomicrobiales bacterium]